MLPAFNVREAGRQRSTAAVMLLSEANASFLRRLHRNDRQLYKAAVALLHQRIKVCREGGHGMYGEGDNDEGEDAQADSAGLAPTAHGSVATVSSSDSADEAEAQSQAGSADLEAERSGALRATAKIGT